MENFEKLFKGIILEANDNVNKLHDFIEKRKTGAKKIQKSAEEKGGPSKLTAIHFAAKEKPYAQALSMTTKDNCKKTLKEKGDKLAKQLQKWHTMSQSEFQTLMGELEAYGEVYLMCVKPNSIKID